MQQAQQMQQQQLEAKAKEEQMKLQVEMDENAKDRQNDITLAEIRSAGFGAGVDIDKNQQSDYKDEMDRYSEKLEQYQTTNSIFKREEKSSNAYVKTVVKLVGIEEQKNTSSNEL